MTHFKSATLLLAFLLSSILLWAQTGKIEGKILESGTKNALNDIAVDLIRDGQQKATYSAITDENGQFTIDNVEWGNYQLSIRPSFYKPYTVSIAINQAIVQLEPVVLSAMEGADQLQAEDIIPTISVDDGEIDNSNVSQQGVSGLLTASRDVFINTAAFTFGQYRFRIRGFGSEETDVLMDGIMMSDLENGRVYWSQWGGLNDVMRNRQNTIGLSPTAFTVGGVGGATQINTRASQQWDQLRLSYSAANRSYRNRLMGTYSTGLMKNGWAVSMAASRRWAEEGYVPGTFYDAWSYFMAVEKVFSDRNALNLTVLGAPNRRGSSTATVQEANDLAGTNFYNANWGYQNGEKRNARVSHSHLPTFILSHHFKINEDSKLSTSVGYQFGRNGKTALNWYNASDPRPDYYRNLPSYIEDESLRSRAIKNIQNDPSLLQINWDRLYSVNATSTEFVENVNNTGRDSTVNLSRYMIEDRRFDRKRVNANMHYTNKLSQAFTLQTGANFNWQRSFNYKLVEDLLGGDVFIDLNQFAERDFVGNDEAIQNDLDNPNRLLKEGDRFGYDYDLTTMQSNAWAQGIIKLPYWEFFATGEVTHTRYFRTGNVRNGLYPDNSLGDSEKKDFINYMVKAGLTYKLNGRNYLFANGAYQTRAPYASNAFISPRTRNTYVDELDDEKNIFFEGGYLLRAPKLKGRAVFYYHQKQDGIDTYSFYYDLERNFVNIALSNIDQRSLGGEFALQAEVYPGLSISGVAAIGQHIYTSRQSADITVDNSSEVVAEDLTIYSKNFFLAGMPQMASTIGVNYRSPKYWFASLNFNYFDRIFIDFNQVRRTEEALDLIEPGTQQYARTIEQQQVNGQFTMDLFAGASWKLDKTFDKMKNSYYLYFTLGINNILNNTDFITGGYEQSRLDVEENNLDRFPPRYFYAYGTNFFFNISFRM